MRYTLDPVNINPFQDVLKGIGPLQPDDTVELSDGTKMKICELMETIEISAADLDSNNDYSSSIECFNERHLYKKLALVTYINAIELNLIFNKINNIANGILDTSINKILILKKLEILKHNAQFYISFANDSQNLDLETLCLLCGITDFTAYYNSKDFNDFLSLNEKNEVVFSDDFVSRRETYIETGKNMNTSELGEFAARLLFDQFEKLNAYYTSYLKTEEKKLAVQEDLKIIQALEGSIHFSYNLLEKETPFETRTSYLLIMNFLEEIKKNKEYRH